MRVVPWLLLAVLVMPQVLPMGVARAQDATTWPHTVTGPNGTTVVVYQPQAVSWPDQKTLTARMALAITPAGAKDPILGTVELSFATTIDNATSVVTAALRAVCPMTRDFLPRSEGCKPCVGARKRRWSSTRDATTARWSR